MGYITTLDAVQAIEDNAGNGTWPWTLKTTMDAIEELEGDT